MYVRYSLIQKAINNASDGDTILVSSGTYCEHVVVNKTVSLVGEDPGTTIIHGNRTQAILKIFNRSVNVTGFNIQNGTEGVCLTDYADFCTITDCRIFSNTLGIFVKSNDNVLNKNVIVNNTESGIKIYASCICSPVRRSIITGNSLSNNGYGIQLINSEGGLVYHNNLVNNTYQAAGYSGLNMWDNGYPSGGNYWSDYHGTDLYSGPDQNEASSDGIGDVSFTIFADSEDQYPLVAPISTFDANAENETSYNVDIISNSSLSAFCFNPDDGAFLRFNATGKDGTTGFCRVTIPKYLLWVENGWTILVSGEQVEYTIIPDENDTYLFFMYQHSRKTIEIQGANVIAEFPSLFILLLFMLAIVLAVMVRKK